MAKIPNWTRRQSKEEKIPHTRREVVGYWNHDKKGNTHAVRVLRSGNSAPYTVTVDYVQDNVSTDKRIASDIPTKEKAMDIAREWMRKHSSANVR